MQPAPAGRRVLIAEDEALILMMVEDTLATGGLEPVSASTLDAAISLACHGSFVAAYLDINLSGETVYPVADVLRSRGIPFLIATGYDDAWIEEDYRKAPSLQKPFTAGELSSAMQALLPSIWPGVVRRDLAAD